MVARVQKVDEVDASQVTSVVLVADPLQRDGAKLGLVADKQIVVFSLDTVDAKR